MPERARAGAATFPRTATATWRPAQVCSAWLGFGWSGWTRDQGSHRNTSDPTVNDSVPASIGTGECVGLRWDSAHLTTGTVAVVRVAVEMSGHVTSKPYPKSRSGRRTVPLPELTARLLVEHADRYPSGPTGVFTNQVGGPLWRGLFRARVWRPALVRAGLLGKVVEVGPISGRPGGSTGLDSNGWSSSPPSGRRSPTSPARPPVGCGSTTSGTRTRHGWKNLACPRSLWRSGWATRTAPSRPATHT